ncbi:MAG: 3-phosphoglycerate dehydrogenase family protein [Betaproteobacteria bacterium]|nr:3-phosphoglycerate dehydrogenase family protein [Gammaproteobacteria bacterium]MDH3436017.1 3-phosphoglycerate dehydrogenase family protein [Betaproteobacteria bacterium]
MAESLKILTLNQISRLGLERFPSGRYVVGGKVADPDAILVRSHDMRSMEVPARVKAIGRAGAGVNNIPVDSMSKRGVPVFNAPGANANAVKELVIAGLLIAARNLLPALKFVDGLQGDDKALDRLVEEGKKAFAGIELPRHTLGVIGLGKIGSLVADAAIKLGMDVLGYDPEITVEAAWSLSSRVKKAHSIDEVLRESEFVTLHVPLHAATRGLINADRIRLMKHEAILLNFSRDGVVDNDAVLEGLAAKRLRGYVCDFPAQKLVGHPLVVALPHLGASTREAEENCAVMVVDQVRDFLENGNIVNAVNFPDVVMGRESPFRLGIANANVPKMVGQISAAVGNARLNIHNMLNKSKEGMAYTLVDVDSPATADVIEEIARIEGVLAVRYLPVEQ